VLHDLSSLTGVVVFLVAIMVLARACADEGLFVALGARMSVHARGDAHRLLTVGVVLAAVVTVVLSLDATVVLLAPVLMAASTGAGDVTSFAAVRLTNTGSTLLPVSNLTNLLAFGATGLGFLEFTAAMLPVWVVGVMGEYAVLRWWFRAELHAAKPTVAHDVPAVPLFPASVLIVVLLALAVGTTPWMPAAAGAVLVAGHALARRHTSWTGLREAANLPLAALVLLWASAVTALAATPAGDWFDTLVPSGGGWAALVATALLGMLVAGVVNNLPATLLLLPAATLGGPATVLALLIGVNVGANLTAVGSLANLLWRRSAPPGAASWRRFHLLGLTTTPMLVAVSATVLWAWTSLVW